MNSKNTPLPVDPNTLANWIESGEAVLVDVREPFEHATNYIKSSNLCPLASVSQDTIQPIAGSRKVVFHCQTGKRSIDACKRLADSPTQMYYLQGGINAWADAEFDTIKSKQTPKIDVMRQVQMTAGLLILIGVVLGVFVHQGFIGISAFVGCGLFFAGFTGWCGMAKLLAKMPWNAIGSQ